MPGKLQHSEARGSRNKWKTQPSATKYLCRGCPVECFLQPPNKVWELLPELNIILIFRTRAEEVEDCTPKHPYFRPVHKCKTQSSAGDPWLGHVQSQILGGNNAKRLCHGPQTPLKDKGRRTVLYDGAPVFFIAFWVLPARPLA